MVSSKEAEYHEEQVDYVHVQIQSSKNIFFRRNGVSMITSHQQLRVDDQVNWEDGSAQPGVCHISRTVGQRSCQNPEEDKGNQ